jgi:WD40 repeat protein
VWDLHTGSPIGEPLTGHTGPIRAVAVGELDGRPVAVSGADDRTVRVWDLHTGSPIGEPLTGHTGPIRALAVGELEGRPVAVSGSYDETVRVWDLRTRRAHAMEIGTPIETIAYVPSSKILMGTIKGLALLQMMGDNQESYGGDP